MLTLYQQGLSSADIGIQLGRQRCVLNNKAFRSSRCYFTIAHSKVIADWIYAGDTSGIRCEAKFMKAKKGQ